jgi:di/tricarboxylate transporter
MSADAWITLATVVLTLGVLVSGRLAPAPALLGATSFLLVVGVIDAGQAFAGFSNSAPITVAALYVLAGGVASTGAMEWLTARTLPRPGDTRPTHTAGRRLLPASLVSSGFLNNTTIVAMLAPRILTWARQTGRSPSRLLIPLSYATILGGLLTAIGTSTNLVVSGLLESSGEEPLGLFEITKVGLPLAAVGLVLLLVVCVRLLPDRSSPDSGVESGIREFTVEMAVEPGGPLVGTSVADAGLRNLEGVYLVEIERDGRLVSPVPPDEVLAADDRLIFAGNVERVVDLHRISGLAAAESHHFTVDGDLRGRRFFEMVVSPVSALTGSTLKDADFRNAYGAAVVAIHRSGARVTGKLGTTVLQGGDVLLAVGDAGLGARLRNHHDFLVVAPLDGEGPPRRRHARRVELVILGLMLLVGTGTIEILDGAIVAAFAMVALRVLSPSEAADSIDLNVIVMIAASFGVGAAIGESGLAETVSNGIVDAIGPWGDLGLLAAVLLATVVLTELVTNNAAAVLMFPIAVSTAMSAGLDPRPFAIAVAVGASASFLSPIGYQTNTMVYGMGGYRFGDYARSGWPLTIAVVAVALVAIPIGWPLEG